MILGMYDASPTGQRPDLRFTMPGRSAQLDLQTGRPDAHAVRLRRPGLLRRTACRALELELCGKVRGTRARADRAFNTGIICPEMSMDTARMHLHPPVGEGNPRRGRRTVSW